MSDVFSKLEIDRAISYATIKCLCDAIEKAGFEITFNAYNRIDILKKRKCSE